MTRAAGGFRVRLVLGGGLVLVLAVLVLEMSGSAQRTAGSNHVGAPVFAASVPGGGTLCQPIPPLPADIAGVRLLIGTYGRPVPALGLRFLTPAGATLAAGSLPAGARQGYVTISIAHVPRPSRAATVCLEVHGAHTVLLGGESGPAGSEIVDGRPQPGNVSLLYLRPGSESWWQLLPTLDRRFALGKASFFGRWTLPVIALVLLAVWVGAVRLLLRELT